VPVRSINYEGFVTRHHAVYEHHRKECVPTDVHHFCLALGFVSSGAA
jgi:hypothetical protein